MSLDIQNIRSQFPILSRKIYNKPLIYLDNAATTQKPQCVIDRLDEIYSLLNANVHRGTHYLSIETTALLEQARQKIQLFVNAASSAEIIFTKGATESINLVAHSFCQAFCKDGDEVIVSAMEHHANIVPWQLQSSIIGIQLKVLPINENGKLKIEELESMFSDRTRLLSITHISNVLGTINQVEKIIEIAHRHSVPVLIDAAQSAPHIKLDVQQLDCDFLVFSAHKMYAPTGVGILYGKEKYLDKMPPYQGGGEMIGQVSFNGTRFNELPYKFEAGTPNFADIIATAQAIDFLEETEFDKISSYETELFEYALHRLQTIHGLTIYGTATYRSSVISFLMDGIHHYDLGTMLDKMGIAVRTGHHCAQPLMNVLGVEGLVRASFAFYNTFEEIDIFAEALIKLRNLFSARK